MMSAINKPVSDERIESLLKFLTSYDDSDPLRAHNDSEIISVLRELQQYRAADEPVAWRYRSTDINGNPLPGWSFSEEASLLGLYQPLYAAPQVTSVSDDIPAGLAGTIISLCAYNVRDKELAQKIWNACRAAMLAAPAVQADQHNRRSNDNGHVTR